PQAPPASLLEEGLHACMPNPWFRFYSEFAHDPKVQMMPEAMQRRLAMIFCLRCNETLLKRSIAFQLRISESEAEETRLLFIENGFIDEDWNVLNWDKRQFISDSSTDRVRRYRQGKKQNETFPKRKETVTVTPPYTETDTEQKQKKPSRAKRPSDPR